MIMSDKVGIQERKLFTERLKDLKWEKKFKGVIEKWEFLKGLETLWRWLRIFR